MFEQSGKAEGKAQVYAFIGNTSGIIHDAEGNNHRHEWVKLNVELEPEEVIEKLSWRSDTWGSNNIVIRKEDMNRLIAEYMQLCEAMFGDKEQRDAWKNIIKSTFYKWHDDKSYRFNLELSDERPALPSDNEQK